ncbi:glutamate--cysteine ligase regulatory subunit [Crocuta crocuta]
MGHETAAAARRCGSRSPARPPIGWEAKPRAPLATLGGGGTGLRSVWSRASSKHSAGATSPGETPLPVLPADGRTLERTGPLLFAGGGACREGQSLAPTLSRPPGPFPPSPPRGQIIHLARRLWTGVSNELRDCIQKTLNEWSSQISPDLVREFPDVLECTVSHAVEKINPDEREEMKVSAKLFIVGSNSSSSTRNAVDMACSVLGVAQLDSVIIASPPIEDGVNLSLEHLQPYWEELENLVQSKKIVAIGTSDLDKTQLEQLYQWAQVKPNSNQVNLASCCVMPPDLTAFAKQFDIQLLTHNDPKELLSEASFQEALKESIPDIQAHEWVPLWLLRYSVIVKSRGIIKSKGYILQAKRRGS